MKNNKNGTLNIFFTSGYPHLDSTVQVAKSLDQAGIKMIEIGMPYSDPLADGEIIQHSSKIALSNGMNIDIMFAQIKEISTSTGLIINIMGYFNQIISMGVEQFLKSCRVAGVKGLIIPDLPMEIYEHEYKNVFEQYEIAISFLITPRTRLARIRMADRLSSGFLYLVADNSITGNISSNFTPKQIAYFKKIAQLNLKSSILIGFGVKTANQYKIIKKYANGAIIGSEFIRRLSSNKVVSQKSISRFINSIVNA